MLFIASGLCDELAAHSEEPAVCAFVSNCVIYKPQQTVTVAFSLAAAPQKESNINFTYRHSNSNRRLLPVPRQCGSFSLVDPLIRYISESVVRVENKHTLTGITDMSDRPEALHFASLLRPL